MDRIIDMCAEYEAEAKRYYEEDVNEMLIRIVRCEGCCA